MKPYANMRKLTAFFVSCLTLFLVAGCGQKYTAGREKQEVEPVEEVVSGDENGTDIVADSYTVVIEVAEYGTITAELDGAAAPLTVQNFVSLAREGFYDGLTFHRIMDGFMIQGGDPKGDGTGGSDQTIKGEFSENGVENSLSHTRGAISMARQGYDVNTGEQNYDSASSQFFIVHEDSTYLDGQYAVFGYVTDGMDVVDAICTDAEPIDDNGSIAADRQPVITSITISQ